MAPPLLRERLQPVVLQDLDAVRDEWVLEVERPDPAAFVEHLVEWGVVDPESAAATLRVLDAPVVGRLDQFTEEPEEDDVATIHYGSWSDTDEVSVDPDGETRLANPLLKFDDTSEEWREPSAETELPPPTALAIDPPLDRPRSVGPWQRAADLVAKHPERVLIGVIGLTGITLAAAVAAVLAALG